MNLSRVPAADELTVEDYLQTPDGPPWYQLVEGRLLSEPAANSDHQGIACELVGSLWVYLKNNPIGRLFFSPIDVILTKTNVFQPDILVVMNSRREIVALRGIQGAPDFVIEILSPSNRQIDRGPKRRIYAQCGVRELWLVDPDARTVESYLLNQNPETPAQTWRPGDILNSALFPGLSIPANEVFGNQQETI